MTECTNTAIIQILQENELWEDDQIFEKWTSVCDVEIVLQRDSSDGRVGA